MKFDKGLGFLSTVPFLSELDDDEKREVARSCSPFAVEAGQALFRQGMAADGLYFIETGVVLLQARLPGDSTAEIARLNPGEILGEIALIDGDPRSASAIAVETATGWFLPTRAFEVLRADHRSAARKILHRLAAIVSARSRKASAGPSADETKNASAAAESAPPTPCERRTEDLTPLQLGSIPFFSGFKPEERRELLASMRRFDLPRWHVLLEEGGAAESCWIVVRGVVEISVQRAGQRHRLGVLGPGRLVGEMALIDDAPRSATARLREDSILLKLERDEMNRILDTGSVTAFKFLEVVCRNLVDNLRRTNRRTAAPVGVHGSAPGEG